MVASAEVEPRAVFVFGTEGGMVVVAVAADVDSVTAALALG